jgi:hypothetical protein
LAAAGAAGHGIISHLAFTLISQIMQNTMPQQIRKYQRFIALLTVCLLVLAACIKLNPAKQSQGQLNLNFRFNMKYYPMVKDNLCGCTGTGNELYAYTTPKVIIRDEYGQKVYQSFSLELGLKEYPLQEGKYSVQYKADLADYITCDSVRDIWTHTTNDRSLVFCVNKNNFKFKSLDTTEYFEIKRRQTTVLSRNY